MKKLFYIIMISVISGLALSSCTEEVVQPADSATGGGKISADGNN